MKLAHILEKYDTTLLDQISADKIDEAVSLRLPQSVIVQEIVSALSSQSYISGKVFYGKVPTFSILNLILQSPDFTVDVDGFRTRVLENVEQLSEQSDKTKAGQGSNAQLYVKILRKAWENDSVIDKSEAQILELVRHELGIWDREHFILMHDDSIISLWDIEQEFYLVRNQLLMSGLILTYENKYVIAEDVASQIRKSFGIELMNDAYKRLLGSFSKEDLATILGAFHLNVSGSKDLLIDRLVTSPIPPTDILNALHLDILRDLCRRQNIPVSGAKNVVVGNIIEYFDANRDIEKAVVPEPIPETPKEPELREMQQDVYIKVLMSLTGQQQYDILYQSGMMTSGTKEEKVKRITDSVWSERTMLNHLRKEDLAQLCRRFELAVSGAKQELVDRILDYTPPPTGTVEGKMEPAIPVNIHIPDTSQSVVAAVTVEAALLPPNWEDINRVYPELQHDEKIVLALLKEAKSITEQDLSRIVAKHSLNWFLYKANMAELIAKVKKEGKPVIQIKSVQNTNIYQWTGNENIDEQVVEKKSARDITDALRHGVVPKHNLDLLMVGQQTARRHLSEILMEVNSNKSHFKFIRGQYGSGKTFVCSWLKEFAIKNEFAVAFMNIGHDQPLSDLPIFFSGLISGLRTPEKLDSGALVDILESWLLNIHNKTAKLEGVDLTKPYDQKKLGKAVEQSIEVELANLSDIEPGFAMALRAFYEGKLNADPELAANAVAWITGSRSLSSQALREIGVKGYLEANTVFPRMRAILEIILGAKYRGLLLLVDELELVRKFPHARQREQALETLRLLIDEAGRNALPGCLVIFTGTDEFFEDERFGLKSYEALAERVMTPFNHETLVSMRQPIIGLESLDRERLASVIFKIRDLYSVAYSWDATQSADDETIHKLIEEWTMFGTESVDRKPRPILREFIQMLDLCEENKGVNLSQFLKRSPVVAVISEESVLSN